MTLITQISSGYLLYSLEKFFNGKADSAGKKAIEVEGAGGVG
jgi:hypothetical protein